MTSGLRHSSEARRPIADDLELVLQVAERVRPDGDELNAWFDTYRGRHAERIAHDLALVRRFGSTQARVLDCGATPLLLTAALRESGYDVVGVDLAPERFAGALDRLHLQVARCDIEREPLPFEDSSLELVVFNELFEHLRVDLIFTLSEVLRILCDDGVLLLSTPNLRSLRGLRNLLTRGEAHAVSGGVYEQYEKLRTLGHMGHVREYTTVELASFLGRIGFEVREVVYRGGHGRGLVGLVERLLPSWRPFQTVVARKRAS
ncbi:MAG: methyltransferase domain-containing protein [Acidobacteriota bacterium]